MFDSKVALERLSCKVGKVSFDLGKFHRLPGVNISPKPIPIYPRAYQKRGPRPSSHQSHASSSCRLWISGTGISVWLRTTYVDGSNFQPPSPFLSENGIFCRTRGNRTAQIFASLISHQDEFILFYKRFCCMIHASRILNKGQ